MVKSLGKGAFSQVLLARHQSLETLCAIKVVPKQQTHKLVIISEAHLLKSFHHEGIPQIYDVEEDEENVYLIEEYVQGLRLDEYLLQQSMIPLSIYMNIITQICDIFAYLHGQIPSPVIYQDLKPEHIYLCGDKIKLIDFGVSTYLYNSNESNSFFGNLLFSAPEVLAGHPPTIASDIYSLGKLMEFLGKYLMEPLPNTIQNIQSKAMEEAAASRFETVMQITEALLDFRNNLGQTHLSKHIGVVACHSACGATHISLGLTCAFNANNMTCYYHEKNLSNALRNTMSYLHAEEKDGCYHFPSFHGYPLYGPGVSLSFDTNAYHIYDLGHDFNCSDLEKYDQLLFICDNALWHRNSALDKFRLLQPYKDKLVIIGNRCTRATALFYAREFSLPVCQYPEDDNPFANGPVKDQLLWHIQNKKGRRKRLFSRKKV